MILPSFDDILTIAATVAVDALWVALGLVGCGMIVAFVCFAGRLAWAIVFEALGGGTIVSVRPSTLPPSPPPKGYKDSRNHETTEETDTKDAPQATIDRLLAMREPVKLMPVLPQLSKNQRDNLMLICADCHFDIHHNPFLDSRLMIERATALGIDLSKRYTLPE